MGKLKKSLEIYKSESDHFGILGAAGGLAIDTCAVGFVKNKAIEPTVEFIRNKAYENFTQKTHLTRTKEN